MIPEEEYSQNVSFGVTNPNPAMTVLTVNQPWHGERQSVILEMRNRDDSGASRSVDKPRLPDDDIQLQLQPTANYRGDDRLFEQPGMSALHSSSTMTNSILQDALIHQYLDLNIELAKVLSLFSIVLTFGVVFPPLAVLGFLAINIRIFITQFLLARVWKQATDFGMVEMMNGVSESCRNVSKKLMTCQYLIFPLPFVFVSFFVFDTMGSQTSPILVPPSVYGPATAMACFPFTVYLCYGLFRVSFTCYYHRN
jgi:hypothetical protein